MMIVGMERKEPKDRERIDAVLKILMKQAPLTMKQEKFCNEGCVERFLKARGDNVKKAAKHLRAVLSWRDSIGTDHLMADEFSAELADGVAYVAGHDQEARPVVVFRIKQDYSKIYSQKSFVRLLVFTLEVAVSSMSRFVDQFVLLFDASFFRSGSTFLNLFIGTLKIIADYYPGSLYRAFVIDPPPLFSLLWKGVRPFVELASVTAVVSSVDYLEDSTSTLGMAAGGAESCSFIGSHPRTASLRFEPSAPTSKPSVGSTSSRFSFTVSRFDSLKPWYLSTSTSASTSTSTSAAATSNRIASPSLVGASPLSARSFSFASPAARSGSTPRTPCPSSSYSRKQQQTGRPQPRTPRPSFLQSPAMLFTAKSRAGVRDREREGERDAFLPFLRFYRKPYDEKLYRAKMRPPLGGLVSIVADSHTFKQPQQQRQRGGASLLHHCQRI